MTPTPTPSSEDMEKAKALVWDYQHLESWTDDDHINAIALALAQREKAVVERCAKVAESFRDERIAMADAVLHNRGIYDHPMLDGEVAASAQIAQALRSHPPHQGGGKG